MYVVKTELEVNVLAPPKKQKYEKIGDLASLLIWVY